MSEDKKTEDFVNITDCLEAVGVFKSVRNFLFAVMLIALIILGACFWLTDLGYTVDPDGRTSKGLDTQEPVTVVAEQPAPQISAPVEAVQKAVENLQANVADVNQVIAAQVQEPVNQEVKEPFRIKYSVISWLVRTCNFLVILLAVMYCLTVMFSLKISLLGRLGGINHISRAFFISLFMLVFVLPWQGFFGPTGPMVFGALYLPQELLDTIKNRESFDILQTVFHYLRFAGWWLVVVVMILCAQKRCAKWSKATLKRLGIE